MYNLNYHDMYLVAGSGLTDKTIANSIADGAGDPPVPDVGVRDDVVSEIQPSRKIPGLFIIGLLAYFFLR